MVGYAVSVYATWANSRQRPIHNWAVIMNGRMACIYTLHPSGCTVGSGSGVSGRGDATGHCVTVDYLITHLNGTAKSLCIRSFMHKAFVTPM